MSFAAAGVFFWATGCGRQDNPPPATPPSPPPPVTANRTPPPVPEASSTMTTAVAQTTEAQLKAEADKAEAEAQKQAEALKAAAVQKLDTTVAATTNAVTTAEQTALALIERVKALTGENKYEEALKILNELAPLKLTPDQQKLVAQLKEQINKSFTQKATSEATKALGGWLNKTQNP